ncbi:SCO6880 family protein [Planosporangium mesophilum]|uniref:PrgI family protein n=1 Tax=Planosporangium mesophilum TaxID=689768 RepID=A0A8J3TJL0_9ACTN|nr:SCO6880 family protein [Planosporangium mesophilum]NJC83156.1 hypothetical protein [Planosporangium mesophilum]GII22575.1 hypothetical protein Pme01_21720 [Planosporangium mesophilum]
MSQFEFPPRSTRGSVLGFTWGQVACVVAAVIAFVVAANLLVAQNRWPAAGLVAVAVLLVVLALVRIRGRRLTDWLPIAAGALLQSAAGQDSYRGAVFAPAAHAGHPDLPGAAAGYRWLTGVAADGTTEIGLLHHRAERTVTAALRCSGQHLVLADTDVQNRRLADWANALNILGTEYGEYGLARWALTERAVPDTSNRARRYLANRAVDTTSAAYQSLAELTAAATPTAQRHDVYLAVCFDVARLSGEISEAGGGDAAIAAVVVDKLAGIEATVVEAGLTSHGWLSPRGYAAVLRTQFDPDDQELVDLRSTGNGASTGVPEGVSPGLAGPAAAEKTGWSIYRHDSGVSQTLWVTDMPRQRVGATWLTPLYATTTSRRTVTLVAEPVPAALAQLAVRRDKVARAGDEVTKRKLRLVRTARETAEARAVEQIDREQAAGHVRYRYAVLVTVTAEDVAALKRDVRAAKRILGRAGCETVTLYGEQDQAFAAGALPLARGLKPMRGWLA